MSRIRSPGYPSLSLGDAIELARKLYEANRTNIVDREAVAKDMGYTGMTGRSAKVLADLAHFGLLEKAGKGGVRVTRRAVEIMYGASEADRQRAIRESASMPTLFDELNTHFSDGAPSDNALRAYLMRNGFASVAIPPVMKAYLETYRYVQEAGATESHGDEAGSLAESNGSETDAASATGKSLVAVQETKAVTQTESRRPRQEIGLMEGERVIFVDEAAVGQYLKLVASGDLDDTLLEALEDFTKRWRKRLRQSKEFPVGQAGSEDRSEDTN